MQNNNYKIDTDPILSDSRENVVKNDTWEFFFFWGGGSFVRMTQDDYL